MLPLSWLANYLRDAKLSGPQLQQAQSSNSSRFNRQENLCRFGIFSYHHIIRPCSINTTYSSDFLCYPSGSCQQNIFLKLKNDSRKHVGLNPLPRAHYYPAQPDHLQPRQPRQLENKTKLAPRSASWSLISIQGPRASRGRPTGS